MKKDSLVIESVTVNEFSTEGIKYCQCIVRASDLPRDIPLDANLRYPSKTGKVYTSQGQGIANGGHTYFAVATAKLNGGNLDRAYVSVMIQVGASATDMLQACARLNSSNKVDNRSIAYKTGFFDALRSKLEGIGFHRVAYFQNQACSLSKPDKNLSKDARCSVNHVLALIDCLDVSRWSVARHPTSLVIGGTSTSGTSISRACQSFDVFAQAFYIEKKLCCLIADEMRYNSLKLAGVKQLPEHFKVSRCAHFLDGTVIELSLATNIALPVVAAFRIFINPEFNNWEFPFESFCDDLINELWKSYKKRLTYNYAEKNSIRAVLSSSETWSTLYIKALEFKSKFLTHKLNASVDLVKTKR